METFRTLYKIGGMAGLRVFAPRLHRIGTHHENTTNSVVLAGTTAELPLLTQIVATDGIATGPGFDIANGQSLTLVSDFDACRSVVPNNNGNEYLLRPVINAVPTAKNGITGFVDTSMLGSHVRVTAQQNGVIELSTCPGSRRRRRRALRCFTNSCAQRRLAWAVA